MSEMEVTEGRLLSQGFGVGGPPAAVEVSPPPRTAETVALEIRTLQQQAQGIILNYAIEIGRRLEEAKAMLPHGEWGAWLKRELDYSQSTAQNFMRIFREYGDSQQSLFGGVTKSQTFGNLSYTKALRLLAITDEEERERFAAENDVDKMSIRKLDEALKKREAAEARAAAAQSALEEQQEKIRQMQDALSEADAAARTAEDERARLLRELEDLRGRSGETNTAAAEAAIAEMAEKVEKADAARKAAIAEMTEKVNEANKAAKEAKAVRKDAEAALAAARKELEKLKARGPEIRELTAEEKDALTAGAVERARAEDAERIRGLEKRIAAANPDVAEFKVRFSAWQEEHRKMMEILGRIAQTNGERAAKLRQAVQAALEQMK